MPAALELRRATRIDTPHHAVWRNRVFGTPRPAECRPAFPNLRTSQYEKKEKELREEKEAAEATRDRDMEHAASMFQHQYKLWSGRRVLRAAAYKAFVKHCRVPTLREPDV